MRVLLVEDDEAARFILRRRIEAIPGVDVDELDRGDVEAVVAARPDVVVLDLNMPGFNGMALTSRLRRRLGAQVRIVMWTGYPEIASMADDVDGFYDKTSTSELVAQIEAWACAGRGD